MNKYFRLSGLLVLVLFVLSFNSAHAYIVGRVSNTKIDYKNRTHIIITGKGSELSTQFQKSAMILAHRQTEVYPDDQVVLISMLELGRWKLGEQEGLLEAMGLKIIDSNRSALTEESLFDELVKFKSISSLSFFGHSAAHVGFLLQNKFDRFNYDSEQIPRLKGHFTQDAYVNFYGCNSGFYMAPKLAKDWQIPVSGALTETNFEEYANDQQWYVNDWFNVQLGSHPKDTGYYTGNSPSLNKEYSCRGHRCIRMQPMNKPYQGYWGSYTKGGLSFYKFFCPNDDKAACSKIMAQSMLAQVSSKAFTIHSSNEELHGLVAEHLCPNDPKGELRKSCAQKLAEAYAGNKEFETYNPFPVQPIKCDFKNCDFKMSCTKKFWNPFPMECNISNPAKGPTTTLFEEYKMYMDGLLSLKKDFR